MSQSNEIDKALSDFELDAASYNQLCEVLYSLSETTDLSVSADGAVYIYRVVQMILNGKYTESMRM